MASIINANSSGGLISTGDTSGQLQLQTVGTTALTISSGQYVTLANGISNGLNVSGAGWGVLPYTANSTVIDNNSGQTRIFATGANTTTYGTLLSYVGTTNGSATLVTTVGKDLTFALQGATQSSGTGIAFPATQSASSDANTLDDYEEGTFTPTFTNISGGAVKTGAYVKIGKMVFVNIFFSNMACTGTSSVTIGGLPFTRSSSASSDGDALTPYELYQISNPTGNLQWLFSTSGSSTTVSPVAYNGTTGASITTANFSFSSATLGISGWYQTAT